MNTNERLKKAEKETDTNPTPGRIKSGNFKKGKVSIRGFRVAIENPIGSIRKGISPEGKSWEIKMNNTYGYFLNSIGKDGEHVDLFIGDKIDTFKEVYIVDQINPDKSFDEHKVMFGFGNIDEAKKAYLSNYETGWDGFGSINTLNLKEFKRWLYDFRFTTKPFKKFKSFIHTNTIANLNVEANLSRSTAFISLIGEVIYNKTLDGLKSQLLAFKDFDTVVLEIRSPGGSVPEGFGIIEWLINIMDSGIKVVTVITANAYSISSLIPLAADKRLISEYGEIMVHNPMIPQLDYANAELLETYAAELRDLENVLSQLYSFFTGNTPEEIKNLLDKETFLSPQKAIELNFADEIIKMEKMAYEQPNNVKEQKMEIKETMNVLKKAISKLKGDEIVNQLYNSTSGDSLEITQQDQSTYSVGDSVNQKEGSFDLVDGNTIVVSNGVIESITPTDAMVVEPNNDGETVAPEGDITNKNAPITEPDDPEISEVEVAIQALTDELAAVKADLADLRAMVEANAKSVTGMNEVQNLVVEAIEDISSKTESKWQPKAKSDVPKVTSGTIFQNLRKQVNQSNK